LRHPHDPQPADRFGGVDLDPIEIGINGNAILGIKESGKSYLGTELGEMLFDAGIPFVAFDPIGIWHNMKVPGRGKGYPIVVAGGVAADIPLTVASAPAIVEAAMHKRVSIVLDLFDMELHKSDWHKIVRECANLLLHRNAQHGLRHVFIEEAAEFVPQRPMDGQTYAAVEKLIRMGGNARLGCTLITPRSQEVNKAVLELCENIFLFRQRGKLALENLKKWLDVAGGIRPG
jgi:DNA helicase HerA-like ATPase